MMAWMLLAPAAKKGLGRSSNSKSELLKSSPSLSMLISSQRGPRLASCSNRWHRLELVFKGLVNELMLNELKEDGVEERREDEEST